MSNATKRPWTIGNPSADELYIMVGGHTVIAQIPTRADGSEYVINNRDERKANAALIVEAVNQHDALRAENQAMREALKYIQAETTCVSLTPGIEKGEKRVYDALSRIARAALSGGKGA